MKIQDACRFLEQFAPLALAESWDNTGLLVGRPEAPLRAVMTCLTLTADSAAEAVENQADLVVTHHPLPFRPLQRITSENPTGRLLLDLMEARIAVYSPHTAFDSAAGGINQRLSEMLGLENIVPLTPLEETSEPLGAGRRGQLDSSAKARGPRPPDETAARDPPRATGGRTRAARAACRRRLRERRGLPGTCPVQRL
jgi:dinuclear metal center YbgI/SA1388 family protein